jgi:hypothetical protein
MLGVTNSIGQCLTSMKKLQFQLFRKFYNSFGYTKVWNPQFGSGLVLEKMYNPGSSFGSGNQTQYPSSSW